jgi:hypothetical protein
MRECFNGGAHHMSARAGRQPVDDLNLFAVAHGREQ